MKEGDAGTKEHTARPKSKGGIPEVYQGKEASERPEEGRLCGTESVRRQGGNKNEQVGSVFMFDCGTRACRNVYRCGCGGRREDI